MTRTSMRIPRVVLILTMGLAALMWTQDAVAVPGQISYTGHLIKGTKPVTGSLAATFKLYPTLTGGKQLWQDKDTVKVNGGVFHAVLGKNVPLTAKVLDGSMRYLEVVLGNQTMSPRLPLRTAPYAMAADNCTGNITPKTVTSSGGITVDPSGADASELYLRTAKTTNRDAIVYTHANGSTLSLATSNTRKDLHINAAGNVGIGTTKPGSRLDVAGTVTVNSPLQMRHTVYESGKVKTGTIKVKYVDMTLPHGYSPQVVAAGIWTDHLHAVLTVVTKNPTDGRYQYVGAWTKPGGNVPAFFYSPTGSKLAGLTFRRSSTTAAYLLNTSGSTLRVVGVVYYR